MLLNNPLFLSLYTFNNKIGKYIKKLRIDNHFTQKDLADKLGVTYQAVSKWENGKNIPDISVLKEMSNLFNVEISEILNGENNFFSQKKFCIK